MTSVARRREHDDSGEYSDASQEIEINNSANDAGPQESDYDSQGSDSEHSDGDPENQETERRVDDDEDRSNPQYIPKRGTFYEHDDRTAASGEESTNTTSETVSEKKEGSEAPPERRRAPRKSDVINKWIHDKYNENEQMPKSRDELVSIYGYDIRNEDAPPHARRNRRYGRGPNKYTRTWEDEEAYRRQAASQAAPRKPPNPEDFPELDPTRKQPRKSRTPRPRSKSQPASNESSENGFVLRRNASIKTPQPKTKQPPRSAAKPRQDIRRRDENMPQLENLTITANVFNNSQGQPQRKVSAPVAQQRPVPTDQARARHTQPPQQQSTQPPRNKSPPQQQQRPQQPSQQQQSAAGLEARGGSKRYSSQRQRPIAETYSPQQQQPQPKPQQQQQPQQQSQPQQQVPQQQQPQPQPQVQPQQQPQQQTQQQQQPQQQQIRYHAAATPGGDFPAGPPPAALPHPPPLMHQVHRATGHAPSPPHQPPHPPPQHPPPQHPPPQHPQPQHTQQVRLGMMEQPPLVPHHALHSLPQHPIGQLQPSQAYAPPAMMPAQFMQQSGSPAVFGAAPIYGQPPAAYPAHQIYPHHNYATQAGGVTYYSCAEQEQQPRTQRRPTAAIPIVRPAPLDRPANSSEKDNIDRIVENMFVRKPWPASGAETKEKSQSENRNSQEPPSKESSQPNSLTSSSISTDSKPSEEKEREKTEEPKEGEGQEQVEQDSIANDA